MSLLELFGKQTNKSNRIAGVFSYITKCTRIIIEIIQNRIVQQQKRHFGSKIIEQNKWRTLEHERTNKQEETTIKMTPEKYQLQHIINT